MYMNIMQPNMHLLQEWVWLYDLYDLYNLGGFIIYYT